MSRTLSDRHFIGDGHFVLFRMKLFLFHFNVRGFEERHGIFVCAVGDTVYDARDACVDERLRTVDAG